MGGESPEDEIGRKAPLIYPTFWSLFLTPMYDHVSFASKVLRTLTAKAPFSSPEPVVSWSRGLGSLQIRPSRICGQEFRSPSRRETGLVPVGNWTKYRKFSIKPPRMFIEFKHIWWEGGALIFAGYPFYFLFTSTICQTAQLHASLGCILMTHRSLMQKLMWIQYS